MDENTNTHPQPDKTPQNTAAHIEGDYVDGDKITGDISAEGVSGSGHQIGHHIYNDPNYPYDVQGRANPYLGLAAFTYAERDRYAGRDAHIYDALAKLTTPGAQRVLLFVTGASGSGKSSFAQAGLLPALEAHYAQRHQTLRRALMRPSQQPLAMLGDALQQLGMPAAQPNIAALTALMQEHTFGSYINVIILDQFEEVFTQSQPIQRDDLLSWLTGLPTFADLRTHVIATMRADYLPELFAHQTLYEIAKEGLDLREMTTNELRKAIQRPLQSCYPDKEKYFEAGLLDRLATDTAADATYLPLLQVTLEQLWDGGTLKLERYGTLTDAIQDRAERVYTETANQDALMAIFLDLVEVSLDDDARRDVRRRRTLAELIQGGSERAPLIDELVSARLLSKDVEQREEQEVQVVDIIHESLLTNWPRLSDAITAHREHLQWRTRFKHWLQDWEDHNRADDYLLEGVRLSEAEELAAQGDVDLRKPAAQALLERSRVRRAQLQQAELRRQRALAEAQRRRAVLFRQALVVVTTLFIVAVGAGIFAFQQQQIANDNAADARSERERVAGLAVANAARAELAQNNLNLAYPLVLAAAQMPQPAPEVPALLTDSIYRPGVIRLFFMPIESANINANRVALAPDNTTAVLATCEELDENHQCVGDTLQLFDIRTKEIRHSIKSNSGETTSVTFSPDGKTILAGSSDSILRLWDAVDGEVLRTFKGHTSAVASVAFSPDGKTFLSTSCASQTDCTKSEVRVWDIASGQTLRVFRQHAGYIINVSFQPDGKTFLSASCTERFSVGCDNNVLQLWDIATGQELHTFRSYPGTITRVAFSPDGTTAFFGSQNHPLVLWDVYSEEELQRFYIDYDQITGMALSSDGTMALTMGSNFAILLWDLSLKEELHTFTGYPDEFSSVALNQHSQRILFGLQDGNLQLWDMVKGRAIHTFRGHADRVTSVAFNPSGTVALSSACTQRSMTNDECVKGEMRVWNLVANKLLHTKVHAGLTTSATFSPDGSNILSVTDNNVVELWDVSTSETLRTFKSLSPEGTIESVAFTSDSMVAISVEGVSRVKVTSWNIETESIISTFERNVSLGQIDPDIILSPDGRTMLSGGCSLSFISCSLENAHLWDVATGHRLHAFEGHNDRVKHVTFSFDGQTALSISDDSMRLWRIVPYNEQLSWLCQNRYIPDLSPEQREQYAIPADLELCPEEYQTPDPLP